METPQTESAEHSVIYYLSGEGSPGIKPIPDDGVRQQAPAI